MKEFFDEAAWQNHPLRILQQFLKEEEINKQAKKTDLMRFVGYVLDIGYDIVTIITSDPYKIAVGGIPRNSLLVMVPNHTDGIPPHFVLLRVLESAPTPLSDEVAQTYFELQKKSMPELDVFTQSELQWGALKTGILGMFYPHVEKSDEVEFSGDINNFVSAHKYLVYSPTDEVLDLIVNEMVPKVNRFAIGKLRLTECRLPLPGKSQPDVPVFVSTKDFMGTRTAMFGKTRLGKSNNVKIIAQSLIETTSTSNNVGQLIFDIDGEYANDNPQDNDSSLAGAYTDRCHVYALNPKPATPSKPLKLNFYEHPTASHRVVGELLAEDDRDSAYVKAFAGLELTPIEDLNDMEDRGERLRATRRILMFWAILRKAGYEANEDTLRKKLKEGFDPNYNANLRKAAYSRAGRTLIKAINTLSELVIELEVLGAFVRLEPNNPLLISSSSGDPLFEADERALLKFLNPPAGVGPAYLQPFRKYHDKNAGDFIVEILKLLDKGQTVILDLSNANEEVRNYFSDKLTEAVFKHQGQKFANNELNDHYIQLYFEEAHNLFPTGDEGTDVYRRIAKEGAKYHIGMVYSTQSITTISGDLLKQTENFFISHLSSMEEVNALAKLQVTYATMKDDILNAKTVGYIRMLTRSHRFVIPVQTAKFTPPAGGKKITPRSKK